MRGYRRWADGYEPVMVDQTPLTIEFQRLDRVRISNGRVLIITAVNPSKPVNCYTGVLENGQGAEYVFGPKHRPVKLGVVDEGHPALLNLRTRQQTNSGVNAGSRVLMTRLLDALMAGKVEEAVLLGGVLRSAGF